MAAPEPIWESQGLRLYDQGLYLLIVWPKEYSQRLDNIMTLEEIGGIPVAPETGLSGYHIPREKYLTFQRFLPVAWITRGDPLLSIQKLQRDPAHSFNHIVTLTETKLLFALANIKYPEEFPEEPYFNEDGIVNTEVIGWSDIDLLLDEVSYLDILRWYLTRRDIREISLQRGDIVSHQFIRKYNIGYFVYDGERIIPLDYDREEQYGEIPSELKEDPTFPKDYWDLLLEKKPINW